jgi:two-component system CheB/CheR fusion protein
VFLPIAEESLLIDNIGQGVLDEAFAQLAGWRSGGLTHLRLSVNVSSRQLRQRDFAERLQQLLIKHGLPGACVVLELTESALLQHDEQLNQLLRGLEQLGVQLSLDDFGTGYSSLAYLRRLPLSELKIDRSFVHGVLDRRDDREIVAAILGLGQALGLRVVAEGVETAEQLQHFRRVSTDLGIQGFHVAKPMAARDCEHWLRDAHLKMKMGHHGVYGHA